MSKENKNANECAFPFEETGKSNTSFSPGLTKREYFAGIALHIYSLHPSYYSSTKEQHAKAAIELADEFLKQLSQPK